MDIRVIQLIYQVLSETSDEDIFYRFFYPATQAQLKILRINLEEIAPLIFKVEMLEVDPDVGFMFSGRLPDNDRFTGIRYIPEDWEDYAPYLPDIDKILGHRAVEVFNHHHKHVQDKLAQQIIERIEKGEYSYEDLREEMPYMFDHPDIQSGLVADFRDNNMPKRKRGKRSTFTNDLLDLYGWACHYYVAEHESLETACAAAVEHHPELVPTTWKVPDETLKRIIPKLDKLDLISQRTFRQNRRD